MTANDLIARALRLIGALGSGQTMSAEALADALVTLNAWIDSLGTDRATIYTVAKTTKVLTAAKQSYTLGSGGDINIVRPLWIQDATLIIDTTASTQTEMPLRIVTNVDEWALVRQKTLASALAMAIYYDYGWVAGVASVFPWPVPSVGTTSLVLYTPTALVKFADAVTDYTFPPGYERAIVFNLAIELAPEWGKAVDPVVADRAEKSLAAVQRANTRPIISECDITGLSSDGGYFDWRTRQII